MIILFIFIGVGDPSSLKLNSFSLICRPLVSESVNTIWFPQSKLRDYGFEVSWLSFAARMDASCRATGSAGGSSSSNTLALWCRRVWATISSSDIPSLLAAYRCFKMCSRVGFRFSRVVFSMLSTIAGAVWVVNVDSEIKDLEGVRGAGYNGEVCALAKIALTLSFWEVPRSTSSLL